MAHSNTARGGEAGSHWEVSAYKSPQFLKNQRGGAKSTARRENFERPRGICQFFHYREKTTAENRPRSDIGEKGHSSFIVFLREKAARARPR